MPKFEVASIRPCKAESNGGRSGRLIANPGRLAGNCVPVRAMIQQAYLVFAGGIYHDDNWYDVPIEGGPAWLDFDRYNIEAKAPGPEAEGLVMGPMLQALLEERFQLKVRREIRQVPVYELVVAKGGSRLRPFDRSCSPVDSVKPSPQVNEKDCRNTGGSSGLNITRSWRGISVDELVSAVLDKQFTGRPVVNRTGLIGLFDIDLAFTPEANRDQPEAGPSIFRAVQDQLGLKLVPGRGPGVFLVIDRVQRPSAN